MSLVTATFDVTKRFLIVPVRFDAALGLMRVRIAGQPEWKFGVKLAASDPDYATFIDLGHLLGSKAKVSLECDSPADLTAITLSDEAVPAEARYGERYRPQAHFSTLRGFTNDPNGLVFYEGEHHLFYQHQPFGTDIGYDLKFWGHAVSTDLVHWEELPTALNPDEHGAMFSGSVVVDWDDSSGLGRGDEPPLVALYTADGRNADTERPFTQCLAFSNDRGRSWTKHKHNPVLGHITGLNRDPRVIWHEPTQRWVMALYLDGDVYGLFWSENLMEWNKMSEISLAGSQDCPDLFSLPVDGDASRFQWVFWAANTSYLIGDFDGSTFTPTSDVRRLQSQGSSYAAQTWNVEGRVTQISWLQTPSPGMPFTNCMTIPQELSLQTIGGEVRLCADPAKEIESLRTDHRTITDIVLDTETFPEFNTRDRDAPGLWGEWAIYPVGAVADTVDAECIIDPGSAQAVSISIRGVSVVYDSTQNTISIVGGMARDSGSVAAKLCSFPKSLEMRILVDRTTVEVYANGGSTVVVLGVIPKDDDYSVRVAAKGGRARIVSLDYWRLESIWNPSSIQLGRGQSDTRQEAI